MDDLEAILAPVERAARQLTNCDTCDGWLLGAHEWRTMALTVAGLAVEAWRATNPERNAR